MSAHWLVQQFEEWADRTALVWKDQSFTYQWLKDAVSYWQGQLVAQGVRPGEVVALDGDYSPRVCALLLALVENRNVVVPLTSATGQQKPEFMSTAQVGTV